MPEVQKRKEILIEARQQAALAMKHAMELQTKPTAFKGFIPGDKVWLEGTNLRTTHPTTKLRPKHFGPFKIIEVVSPMTYRLELPTSWKVHNAFHGALLTKAIQTKENGPLFKEPPPELIEGEPEYKVEAILGSRHIGRAKKLQFLVKWKGWATAHNSWEPKENVHALELVKEFYELHKMVVKTCQMSIIHPTVMSNALPPIETINDHSSHCVYQFGSLGSDNTDVSSLSSLGSDSNFTKLCYPWVDDASTQVATPIPDTQPVVPVKEAPVIPCADSSELPTDVEEPPFEPPGIHPGPPWFQYHDLPEHGPMIVNIAGCTVELPFL